MSQFTYQPDDCRPIHVWTDNVEQSARVQLENMAQMPFLHPHGLAVMPDVHCGIGSTVGTVIATQGAIIPAAVGVDIGCGMNAVRTSLRASDLPDNLSDLRHSIERGIPLGPGGAHRKAEDMGNLLIGPGSLIACEELYNGDIEKFIGKAAPQLGTLGSGNHFIELCLDENQDVWVMLHSGSRGIGNMIGTHYIAKAKKLMERYFITLPDENLAYFPDNTVDYHEYVSAVHWAQDYALENRRRMMATVYRQLVHAFPDLGVTFREQVIECHHNYVALENHFGKNTLVTRKGAIRAREGDLGIIPGSMGTRSYIVRGLGNPDSYHSCSHGAGRIMSRAQAKKQFTLADLVAQTEGVECNKNASVIDEIPSSYKNIDEVMAKQADLVEAIHTLKQVMCIKGN